jgi:hypothetical protein
MTSTDNREFVHTMFGISPPTSPHTARSSKLQCQDENVDTTTTASAAGDTTATNGSAIGTDQGLMGTLLHNSSSGYHAGETAHDVSAHNVSAGDSTAGNTDTHCLAFDIMYVLVSHQQ